MKLSIKNIKIAALLGASIIACTSVYVGLKYYTPVSSLAKPILSEQPEEIAGNIITLKTLKEEYVIDFHNAFSNKVRKDLEYPEHITLGWTINYVKYLLKKIKAKKTLYYCIFDNHDKKLIGAIQIREPNPKDPGQMGCWLNENYWGGGRFQEALSLATKTYFTLKPVDSFTAHVRLWNQRSYHALKKGGFVDFGYFYENNERTRYILEMRRK